MDQKGPGLTWHGVRLQLAGGNWGEELRGVWVPVVLRLARKKRSRWGWDGMG